MTTKTTTIPRVNILGVGVSNISLVDAAKAIEDLAQDGGKHYVCVSNVHTVMMCQSDPEYKRIHNEASMVTPDGMPLAWMERKLGYHQPGRVYGPDLTLEVCKRSPESGLKHYFYGGEEGVPEELTESFRERFPGIQIVGGYSPPFRPLTAEEDEDVVQHINDSGADVVWVGLGAPKQERWMAEHRDRITCPVMVGVGAAFAFHTGRVSQSPAWLQSRGLEWAYRLYAEPRRLWRRYLYNNPLFMIAAAAQLTGLKKYELKA